MDKKQVLDKITESKIVAVVREETIEAAEQVSKACILGGVKAIELTFTLKNVTKVIDKLSNAYREDESVLIGAGTVLDAKTARMAIDAGAAFIVSPGFDQETALLCNTYGVPYVPGCISITEMLTALKSGVEVIKLFPGSALGPDYIKAVKGPLPHIKIMPTGGVDLDNVSEWLEKGAIAVGVGSNLTSLKKLKSLEAITDEAARYVEKVNAVRAVEK
ncbi:MAG: bifunctional 2-keto-4-hydroxyglutarate aldolase/2-keto-3-deoxy-6-phosphogluconate aldolase [Bacillota bacterium]